MVPEKGTCANRFEPTLGPVTASSAPWPSPHTPGPISLRPRRIDVAGNELTQLSVGSVALLPVVVLVPAGQLSYSQASVRGFGSSSLEPVVWWVSIVVRWGQAGDPI